MIVNIPLVIGRQSSGEEYIIDLAGLPNLFISYSNEIQLPAILLQIINQVNRYDNTSIKLSYSLNSRLAEMIMPLVNPIRLHIEFPHSDYEEGKINSIDEFIDSLIAEMKIRKALLKKPKRTTITFQTMLVIIDDVFEVIMSSKKKTALSFIELLITAAEYNMFFIMGSSGIYRNLLNQIMEVSSSLQQKLKKSLQKTESINHPLGAELVINPDGLIFFRKQDEKIHTRLYPFYDL